MARGQQKIQSQKKNQEKQAAKGKSNSTLKQPNKALVFKCTVCMVGIFFPFSFEIQILVTFQAILEEILDRWYHKIIHSRVMLSKQVGLLKQVQQLILDFLVTFR